MNYMYVVSLCLIYLHVYAVFCAGGLYYRINMSYVFFHIRRFVPEIITSIRLQPPVKAGKSRSMASTVSMRPFTEQNKQTK